MTSDTVFTAVTVIGGLVLGNSANQRVIDSGA